MNPGADLTKMSSRESQRMVRRIESATLSESIETIVRGLHWDLCRSGLARWHVGRLVTARPFMLRQPHKAGEWRLAVAAAEAAEARDQGVQRRALMSLYGAEIDLLHLMTAGTEHVEEVVSSCERHADHGRPVRPVPR